MRKSRAPLYLVLICISCSPSFTLTPPLERQIERSRVYDLEFEIAWTRAVDWFADHNVTIEKIEKSSGLITAKYLLKAPETYLDCGEVETSGTMGTPHMTRYGSLNVTVRKIDENRTRINVNFFGEFEYRTKSSWDGSPVVFNGQCVSTGELEKLLLDFVGK